MKILVECINPDDPLKWLVTTDGGYLIASFRFQKYAKKFKKLVKKGGFTILRKYSPYNNWGFINVMGTDVKDTLETVIECETQEIAIGVATCLREAKGAFILNGPVIIDTKETKKKGKGFGNGE